MSTRAKKPATLTAFLSGQKKSKATTLDTWLGLKERTPVNRRKKALSKDVIVIDDDACTASHKNQLLPDEIWMRIMTNLEFDDIRNLKAAWWSVGVIANQIFPNMRFIWPESLFSHQAMAVDWVKSIELRVPDNTGMRGGILALEMGLGKTLIMLSTIFRKKQTLPTLVVTHKVLLETWMNELKRFFPSECSNVYILHADTYKKGKPLTYQDVNRYKLVLTTFETVSAAYRRHPTVASRHTQRSTDGKVVKSWLPSLAFSNNRSSIGYDLFFDKTWGRLIIDETDKIMNHRGNVYLSLMAVPAIFRWCLSGTPIRNKAVDLRSVLAICGANSLPKGTRCEVIELVQGYGSYILRLGYDKAHISLPPKTVATQVVPFVDPLHRQFYDLLLSTVKRRLGSSVTGEVKFTSILTLFLLMRIVCISPSMVNHSSIAMELEEQDGDVAQWAYYVGTTEFSDMSNEMRNYLASGKSAKFDAAVCKIRSMQPHQKCVIFSGFDLSLRLLSERLLEEGIGHERLSGQDTLQKRTKKLDTFRGDPDCKCMLLSYRLGGKGLQLTNATEMIMLDPWWCPAEHEQAEARCHRIGQKYPVNVTYLVMQDSIEMEILRVYCGQKAEWKKEFDSCTSSRADSVKLNFEWLRKLFSVNQ